MIQSAEPHVEPLRSGRDSVRPEARPPGVPRDLPAIFDRSDVTIGELAAAGWEMRQGSHPTSWWFVNIATGERKAVPYWIRELVDRAERKSREGTLARIWMALGLKVGKLS